MFLTVCNKWKLSYFYFRKCRRAFVADHLHEKVFSLRTNMFPFFRHILDLWVFMMNLSFFHTAQLSSNGCKLMWMYVVILIRCGAVFRHLSIHCADNFLKPNSLLMIWITDSYQMLKISDICFATIHRLPKLNQEQHRYRSKSLLAFFSFMKWRNPVVIVVEQTRSTLTWLIMLSTCPKKNLCHIIVSKIPIWGFRQGSNFIRNYQSYLSIPLVSIVVSFLLKPPYFYRSVRFDVSVRVGSH